MHLFSFPTEKSCVLVYELFVDLVKNNNKSCLFECFWQASFGIFFVKIDLIPTRLNFLFNKYTYSGLYTSVRAGGGVGGGQSARATFD